MVHNSIGVSGFEPTTREGQTFRVYVAVSGLETGLGQELANKMLSHFPSSQFQAAFKLPEISNTEN